MRRMTIRVLYLDKLNERMENMLLERCDHNSMDVRFLNPTKGRKGELNEADMLIDTTYRVTKDVIDAAPHLKLIQRTGIGVDMVDVAYARSKGIPVSVCRGFNSNAVAELTILDILSLYRHFTTLNTLTHEGQWNTWTYRHESYEIQGKTVGVLGAGTIGRNVIRKLREFNAHVIYFNGSHRLTIGQESELGAEYRPFADIIRESDILSLHLPLKPSTEHIIGEKEFDAMKPTAILIDTARDSLVDLPALVNALKNRKILGAAIDIFAPVTERSQLDDVKGLNLVLTPHIGAATYDNYDKVYRLCAANARHILRSEEPEMTL